MAPLNDTHDPGLRSWVESAQQPGCDFPIQNLPHGVFRLRGSQERFRGGVAIGDQILDIGEAAMLGVFDEGTRAAAWHAAAGSLNGLMAAGPTAWSALRRVVSRLLREGAPQADSLRGCLVAQHLAEYAVPARIGNYTDFFTSPWHALNAGRIFQPANPLLPNFKWLPIGYHGRASSIEISGTPFRRPWGQSRAPGADVPGDGPSQRLDYELELGAFIGPGNCRGEPIPIDAAEDHLFGLCLLNDWSARDVQAWESMPLGPFLSKSFITTVSPWIVTLEALAPFRCALPRQDDDPPTLPYLRPSDDHAHGAFDIQLEAWLSTAEMHAAGAGAARLSRTSFRHAYWSPAQWVAHHTHNGCNLQPGDLLGSGTQSGPTNGEEGCLLELGRGGTQPVALPNGQTRCFLEDGDTLLLRAWCERDGHARIGFGECNGTVLPAWT